MFEVFSDFFIFGTLKCSQASLCSNYVSIASNQPGNSLSIRSLDRVGRLRIVIKVLQGEEKRMIQMQSQVISLLNLSFTRVNVFGEDPHLCTVESGHVFRTALVLLSTFMIERMIQM